MGREDERAHERGNEAHTERGDVVTQISEDKKTTICKGIFLSGTVSSNPHSNQTPEEVPSLIEPYADDLFE